ncbi:MAG: YggT family protein [bacterium]
MSIYQAISQLFQLMQLILIVRILLSWFPNIDWWKQPFKFLHAISEPILAPFRRMVPSLGGLDISPIFAFIFLEILQSVVLNIAKFSGN